MQLLDIGPRGYSTSLATANKQFTPLFDRAAKITDVRITSPSARDIWTFTVGGKELFRGLVDVVGFQNPFGTALVLGVANRSWLPYVSDLLGMEVCIPVPNGQTLTVASVGGATADISFEFEEVTSSDISTAMVNHYQGNRFIHPLVQYMAAAIAGNGPTALDTQISPAYVPKLLNGDPIPPNWKINLLAMWLQPQGINTFSGAANHVSNTVNLSVLKNGQRQFTRDATGVPLVGGVAAAGSANSVLLPLLVRANAFQLTHAGNNDGFDPMISLGNGDNFEIDVTYAGDYTGGPVYDFSTVLMLADITQLGV